AVLDLLFELFFGQLAHGRLRCSNDRSIRTLDAGFGGVKGGCKTAPGTAAGALDRAARFGVRWRRRKRERGVAADRPATPRAPDSRVGERSVPGLAGVDRELLDVAGPQDDP